MKIGFVGYDYWCRVTADYLTGSDYQPVMLGPAIAATQGWRDRLAIFRAPPLCDIRIIHCVFAFWSMRWMTWFRLHRRRIVLHWVGSDYLMLVECSGLSRRLTLAWMAWLRAVHLVDSPELADELAEVGIRGQVVRLLPQAVAAQPSPLPDKPVVMAYWSPQRADFYGRPVVYALARRWPDIPFRIVGTDHRDPQAPANVEFLGYYADLDPIYQSCSVLIRVLPHDSLSTMVLEALARGRDVIYSKPFPHTRHATDVETAAKALAEHLKEYEVNAAGARYVADNFKPAEWAGKLLDVYAGL